MSSQCQKYWFHIIRRVKPFIYAELFHEMDTGWRHFETIAEESTADAVHDPYDFSIPLHKFSQCLRILSDNSVELDDTLKFELISPLN
jgi:hypothetical protein